MNFLLVGVMVLVVECVEEDNISTLWNQKMSALSRTVEAVKGKTEDLVPLQHDVFKLKNWFRQVSVELNQVIAMVNDHQKKLIELTDMVTQLNYQVERKKQTEPHKESKNRQDSHRKILKHCDKGNFFCNLQELIKTEVRNELEKVLQNSPVRFLEEEMYKMKDIMVLIENNFGSTSS